jgi:MFS family permease
VNNTTLPTTLTETVSLPRDRFTWLAYIMLAYYAYMQSMLGPLVPFLRSELDLNYTVAGLHLSAFAVGMIVAGLISDQLARRWGRRTVYWGGASGMGVGALLLVLARQPLFTIGGVLIMGFVGSFVMVMVQAMLSDRHGDRRATALTEANIAAAISSMLAPLAVGAFVRVGFGWRWAPIIGSALAIALALRFGRDPVPEGPGAVREDHVDSSHPVDAPPSPFVPPSPFLPGRFWVYWLVIVSVVAGEWCLIFWGADFLENAVGLPKALTATLQTVFWLAYVAGRFGGSGMTRFVRADRLLVIAFGISIAGFPLFWLGGHPWVNVLGLFVVGLGLSNLFPLAMAAAVGAASERANTASARISLGAGLAILIVPLVLGGFADHVGIFNAYGIVAVLLVVGASLSVVANRIGKTSN